ncbi:4709_t:CDS:1 [Diversispora eburnea]|uniref:4709_t:CDS:1 n=1 Tax=Diversispora eburnea TaxID=1213867 RepID=A0A9N8UV24_9GLOM|nr:4709_t:CDS:1 [Diversispora eburnea]
MTDRSQNLLQLWNSASELTIGQMSRYRILFDKSKHISSSAWPPTTLVLEITNTTSMLFRGAILSGPYNISASFVESKYRGVKPEPTLSFPPKMKASIQCGDTWQVIIDVPTSGIGNWIIDILSEILFTSTKVKYDVKLFATIPKDASIEDEFEITKNILTSDDGTTTTFSSSIEYVFLKNHDLFKLPDLTTLKASDDYHLIVLTHGIHGTMLDELFLKEAMEEKHKDKNNIFFMSDLLHSYTESGIEACGKRLSTNLLEYLRWPWDDNRHLISKISFIGHSLGGLINLFLIGYLHSVTEGKFFSDIKPINFIAIASPFLGSSDLSWYITAGLRIGIAGQTGKDLALIPQHKPRSSSNVKNNKKDEPLLLSLAQPNSPSHITLCKFQCRTIYANVANDVPVSFRSSALYFHDPLDINLKQTITIAKQLNHLFKTINPSITTEEFIKRTCQTKSPIVHDKVYSPSDIPLLDENEEINISIEEKIARAWHKDMTWRKVFILLEGDAHTNVIVRRKWLNISGWKVIEHLSNEHEL